MKPDERTKRLLCALRRVVVVKIPREQQRGEIRSNQKNKWMKDIVRVPVASENPAVASGGGGVSAWLGFCFFSILNVQIGFPDIFDIL